MKAWDVYMRLLINAYSYAVIYCYAVIVFPDLVHHLMAQWRYNPAKAYADQ